MARAADEAGLAARAAAGYPKALSAGLGGQAERYGYADGARQARPARRCGAPVQAGALAVAGWPPRPPTCAPGRWCATARWSRAAPRWSRSAPGIPSDTTAASSALFLLGDLASDDRADRLARTYYRRAALRYPDQPLRRRPPASAPRWWSCSPATPRWPAREFDELARRYPRSDEAPASVYWAGRAWAIAGDSVKAHARWRKATVGDPTSYYASLAARRLGLPAWAPAEAVDTFMPVPDADSVVAARGAARRGSA